MCAEKMSMIFGTRAQSAQNLSTKKSLLSLPSINLPNFFKVCYLRCWTKLSLVFVFHLLLVIFKSLFANDNFMLFFRTGSVVFFVILTLYALLLWRVSKRIQQRVRYNFVLGMAFFSLFTGVLGLLLGLFSLVQLSRSKHRTSFA